MDKILSLLGIANRANKLYLGDKCLDNMDKVKYLFIASDASEKSKERYLKKAYYYKVPYNLDYPSDVLSNAIGKHNCKIVGLIDQGFKKTIDKYLREEKDGKTNI